jgi:hypothetical protein
VKLIRATGTRVTVADVDSVPELAWPFLSLNKDFLQLLGVKEDLERPTDCHFRLCAVRARSFSIRF